MFAKLRTAKYMKTQANPNETVIEFAGNVHGPHASLRVA
ncbi:phage virion morphogenesis protein [Pantoea agglomerans]|nr:phage virion morphogenesis protein [Pantoea agglomerans]